jgi:hypothetical protein
MDEGDSRFRVARIPRSVLTHEPSNQSNSSQSQRATFEQATSRRWTRFGVEKLAVDVGALVRWSRSWTRTTLGRRDPSRNRCKHLGCTDRTLFRVMHLFAIETQACVSELHVISLLNRLERCS